MSCDPWDIHRAEDIEECMFIPVEEKEHHQCFEDQPEELDTEAEQNFVALDASPFNGLAFNISEGLQEQSNDGIRVVTSGQESIEIASNLCTEETPNDSANKAIEECMFIPVEEKEHHQCSEDQPEELDTEAEHVNQFVALEKSPFSGVALNINISEGLQEQSNDGTRVVTSGQESVEIASNLCTEETPNDSANKTIRDDYEIMCATTDTIAGKDKELSSSEDQPEELDTEAEQKFGALDKSPFNGLALNISEGLQEQSNDGIRVVTSGQESVEIASNLCAEKMPKDSANKAVRDDYEIMHDATDATAGKGTELSSTESTFTNPNTAISAANETVTYSQISKESTASCAAVNKLDKDKQNCISEMPKAKRKASYKGSRQHKLPENMHQPTSRGKERKAETDMKRRLEYQAKLAQKINALRYEHQLKENKEMAAGSYESPFDKHLRRIDEEIALIKGLMDLVKSLTEGEEDQIMCLSAIETIEAFNRNFTPSILMKYPVVIIFESIRRYANSEKIRGKGENIYSLFEAMFPKDGFEDFVYAFERALKIYRESFVKEEQSTRNIIKKMFESVGKKGRSAFTLESWNTLHTERYIIWNKFFQAYDKPKESTVKQGEKKKPMKAGVKKLEDDADDVKNNDLPKRKLRGKKRSRPTSTITNDDLCKVEPTVEEKKFKILKDEDEKPDVKSATELSVLKQSPDLSLVKIKEERLENDENSVVCIKTEFLSDNKNVRVVKGKGRKQPDRKCKQVNQNGQASTIEQKAVRKCHLGNSSEI